MPASNWSPVVGLNGWLKKLVPTCGLKKVA
jgi:hypothetical protein